jgi:hypothetical protein
MQLLGCIKGDELVTPYTQRYGFLAVTLSALVLSAFLICVIFKTMRRGDDASSSGISSLDEHLIEADLDQASDKSSEGKVWLAPEITATQFMPSHAAAMEAEASTAKSTESPAGPVCPMSPSVAPSEVEQTVEHVWLAPIR